MKINNAPAQNPNPTAVIYKLDRAADPDPIFSFERFEAVAHTLKIVRAIKRRRAFEVIKGDLSNWSPKRKKRPRSMDFRPKIVAL